jgi:general secretion pathway protein A
MYLEHLQLKTQPFAEHAAVGALWQDQRMDEGLARLEYLLQCGQLGLVTGPSGVGKSALLKRFLHGLLPQRCQALYCHLSHLPPAGLLKRVVTQLGETPRRGKERVYEQILERASRAEGTLLLIFDEAHLLDGDALTDLRLLISSALDVRPPLKLLLVGQEPLRALLRRAQHADLVNRISIRYQLRPLSREQTCHYIDFQLTQAGGDPRLIDDSVKTAIHDFANGLPRQINNLATACLLQATARKVRRVDDELFQQVLSEFQLP